jgi:hypothetical protein
MPKTKNAWKCHFRKPGELLEVVKAAFGDCPAVELEVLYYPNRKLYMPLFGYINLAGLFQLIKSGFHLRVMDGKRRSANITQRVLGRLLALTESQRCMRLSSAELHLAIQKLAEREEYQAPELRGFAKNTHALKEAEEKEEEQLVAKGPPKEAETIISKRVANHFSADFFQTR